MTLNVTAVKRPATAKRRFASGPGNAAGRSESQPARSARWVSTAFALLLLVVGLFLWYQVGSPRGNSAPTQGYVLIRTYPHSTDAYCQGLAFHDGFLLEGTGNYGKSSLRKVELETGRVVQERKLDSRMFGEGITVWKQQIIQLTWKSQQALVYDVKTLREQRRYSYRGEGWGLTHDGRQLIMSDGTSTLRFIDPETFRIRRQLTVRDGRRRISKLNELEYVEGEIYANIWYEDRIARIAPQTGQVIGWLDLSEIYPRSQRAQSDAVLNGIAYDPRTRRLLVTGKNWPQLYEIRLPE